MNYVCILHTLFLLVCHSTMTLLVQPKQNSLQPWCIFIHWQAFLFVWLPKLAPYVSNSNTRVSFLFLCIAGNKRYLSKVTVHRETHFMFSALYQNQRVCAPCMYLCPDWLCCWSSCWSSCWSMDTSFCDRTLGTRLYWVRSMTSVIKRECVLDYQHGDGINRHLGHNMNLEVAIFHYEWFINLSLEDLSSFFRRHGGREDDCWSYRLNLVYIYRTISVDCLALLLPCNWRRTCKGLWIFDRQDIFLYF